MNSDYKVYSMNKLDEPNVRCNQINCFIFLFTDEERALCVISNLWKNKIIPQIIIVMYFNDGDVVEIDKLSYLRTKVQVKKVKISQQLIVDFLIHLRTIAGKIADIKEIGIDITCIPTPLFIQIINFLHKQEKTIIVYYSQPNHYMLDELFGYLSLNGELKIANISGFSGKAVERAVSDRLLIYQIGFEGKSISKRITEAIEPKKIIPLNGFPSYFPKYKDISLINNNVDYYADGDDISFAEANNPFDTYNQLLKICSDPKSSKYCIDIMVSGTKPMALGACLFALKNATNPIRLLFPFPAKYEIKQSKGTGTVWEYIL